MPIAADGGDSVVVGGGSVVAAVGAVAVGGSADSPAAVDSAADDELPPLACEARGLLPLAVDDALRLLAAASVLLAVADDASELLQNSPLVAFVTLEGVYVQVAYFALVRGCCSVRYFEVASSYFASNCPLH